MRWGLLRGVLGLCILAAGCGRPPRPGPAAEIRIVSLAPSITESLCAIGAADLLVGRTSACNYPPEIAGTVPVIGGFGRPSLEMLADVHPTLVLDVDLADESTAAHIEAMGIPRRRLRCRSIDDIAPMLRELGRLTKTTRAAALADALAGAVADARTRLPAAGHRPSVYPEVWHDPLTTVGRDTFLADLIELAGGRAIGGDVDKPYFQIAPEQVLAKNPDVILCLYMGPSDGAAAAVARRPGWEHVSAVRNECVFEGLDNDVLLRPGPRLLEGLDSLRACMEKARAIDE